MSSSSRVAEYRQRLKQDPMRYQEYLKKEKERNAKRREQQKINLGRNTPESKQLKEKLKSYERERKRKYRERNKQSLVKVNDNESPTKAYSRPQSLGKAVKKVKRALPKSPSKRRAVARKLILEMVPDAKKLFKKKINVTSGCKEIDDKVINFYGRDDISRQEPGKRDVCSVKDTVTGLRSHQRRRILLMPISEAHSIFVEENPGVKVKKSKFFSLRPKHVLPYSKMPHNVCVCKYHANMEFLLSSISGALKEKSNIPRSCNELVSAVTCDPGNKDCINDHCEYCDTSAFQTIFEESDLEEPATLRQWEANESGYLTVTEKSSNVRQLVLEVSKQLPFFQRHVFVKKAQASYFEKSKLNLMNNEVVLQVDFAENYSLISQDEIQTAHWSHDQITVFTAVAWLPNNSIRNYAVISDDLEHGKVAVWIYLRVILSSLKEEYPCLERVKFFSDGAAAQFKNRFTLSNLLFFEEDFGVSAEWNFFASSHGKGAVDGVGGKVKHSVWLAVKSRKYVVNSLESFFECAQDVLKSIELIMVYSDAMRYCKEDLEKRWEQIRSIPHLQRAHCIKYNSEEGCLSVSQISDSNFSEKIRILPQDNDETAQKEVNIISQNIKPGDLVHVHLDTVSRNSKGKDYYALVLEKTGKECHLRYMHPSGKMWIWPDPADESFEPESVVLKVVNPPDIANNRGQFQFK